MKRRAVFSVPVLVSCLLWNSPAFGKSAKDMKAAAAPKCGLALSVLHAEHTAHKARRRGKAFRSANSLLPLVGDRVIIDAVASGYPNALRADLEALGMQDISQVGNVVSGLMPIASIDEMEALGSLQFARPSYALARAGLTTSQGDRAMRADEARALFGVDGTGVTIGILSDSFDALGGAADDVDNGDLPAGIVVLDDTAGGTDEGRAMMQLIHDVAPGASQAFHTAFGGLADFAVGIQELAGCPSPFLGCTPGSVAADVIVDDVIYFAEPMFQDGIIAQAVDVVTAAGVSYFSSAGNNARDSYEAPFVSSGLGDGTGTFHDFDPGGGVDTCQSITIPTGTTYFSFQWTEPFFSVSGAPGSASDVDIRLFPNAGCSGAALGGGIDFNIGGDPVEVFAVSNGGPAASLGLRISLYSGEMPARVKHVAFSSSGFLINEYDTASGTIYGHANAAGAETVGAAFYEYTPEFGTAPPLLESFSSAGPTAIFFNTSGLPTVIERKKPEIVAPDGTNTTFFGGDFEPDGFPNFFGTSAAAPHAAAVAALMLDAAGPLTPAAVYSALESTAIDMDDPATPGFDVGFDFGTGFGLIDAALALADVASPRVLTSIDVTPDSGATIDPGQTQQFTAVGTFNDQSTEDLTNTVSWQSSAPGVATIDITGLATGVGGGTTLITASDDGVTSNAASFDVVVPVDVVTILSAEYKADRKEFKVRATSSQQPDAVLTVVGFGQMTFKKNKYELKIRPLAPELVPPSVTVESSLGGSATAAVIGAPAPPAALVSINVTPLAPSVAVGLTLLFTATGTFDDSSTADLTNSVAWQSSAPGVATINAAGLATGVSAGTTSITAAQDGVTSNTATLAVTPPAALVSIAVTPSPVSIDEGQTQQFTATGTFDDSSTADLTSSVTWQSDTPSVATIDATGLATGVSAGPTLITAAQDGVTSNPAVLNVLEAAGDEVTITKAEWKRKNSELKVVATSSAQPGAVLTVVGYGTMTFKRGAYELRIKPVPNPGTVAVTSSLGGSATKSVRIR